MADSLSLSLSLSPPVCLCPWLQRTLPRHWCVIGTSLEPILHVAILAGKQEAITKSKCH